MLAHSKIPIVDVRVTGDPTSKASSQCPACDGNPRIVNVHHFNKEF
jgi:hypothetical protein